MFYGQTKSYFKESKAIFKSVFQMDKMSSVKRDVIPSDAFQAICDRLSEIDII